MEVFHHCLIPNRVRGKLRGEDKQAEQKKLPKIPFGCDEFAVPSLRRYTVTDVREKTIPSRAGGSSPAQAVDMRGMPYFYSLFVAAVACLLLLLALPARGQNQKATCLQRPRSRRLYRAKFSPCQGEGECAARVVLHNLHSPL